MNFTLRLLSVFYPRFSKPPFIDFKHPSLNKNPTLELFCGRSFCRNGTKFSECIANVVLNKCDEFHASTPFRFLSTIFQTSAKWWKRWSAPGKCYKEAWNDSEYCKLINPKYVWIGLCTNWFDSPGPGSESGQPVRTDSSAVVQVKGPEKVHRLRANQC